MSTNPSQQFSIAAWKTSLAAAIGLALLFLAVYFTLPLLHLFHRTTDPEASLTRIYEVRDYFITLSAWLIAFVLYPPLCSIRSMLRTRWRPACTAISLAAACAFISLFILHFGNRQFGLYDFGILIDTGWRQLAGQRPYVDFLTATPPGFNLGIKYAFQIFGLNWNAQLYATAFLATGSFLWLYWLLARLTARRMVAFWLAFATEMAITLELSFWWYNNETETFVILFFLSCLLLCRQPRLPGAQVSYYFSLWPLALMKPNMAATMGLCGIVLVLCVTDRKLRVVLLTLASAATALLFLSLNKVSIAAMLANYHAAAIEHGLTFFGLRSYRSPSKLALLLLWIAMLALPFAAVLPEYSKLFRQRLWPKLAFLLFFPSLFLITMYGLTTNSDLADLQLVALLVGGTVLLFGIGMPAPRPILRRAYVALLFAMLASDLYAGVMRWRVQGIGPGQFFEWRDAAHSVNSKFFSDLHASGEMSDASDQIKKAISDNQGPFFLGPRLEMGYALNGIPSPDRMPVVWEPGTFFARKDEGKLLQTWEDHRFKTLIFLKGDYTFYTPEFMSLIHSDYSSDDRYPELTVYHLLVNGGQRGGSSPMK